MNDDATFNTVLQTAVGMNQPRQVRAITTFGFSTCRELMSTTEEDVRALLVTIERNNANINVPVRINMSMRSRLLALRSEFLMRDKCGAEMMLAELITLTTNEANDMVTKHRTWKEAQIAAKALKLPEITVPSLTKLNWKDFNRALNEVLARQRGMNNVPITYVTRENANNLYDIVYDSTEKQLIACLRHAGQNYNTDREAVYSLLVQYSKGSEAESIVDQFSNTRNGRAAYRAMVAHMQSTSYMDNLRTSAMARIQAAKYKGEKKDFGIVKYFTVHSNAHNDMESAGEIVTEGMKITYFMNGLMDTTAVTYAVGTKSEPGMATFQQFYNSFSAKLTSHITLTKATSNNERNINAMYGDNEGGRGGRGRGRGRGGRGRGRGRQYRGGYRGGRGRGRSSFRGRGGRGNHNGNDNAAAWRAENRDYNADEWQSLSYDQRDRIRDLRSAMYNNNDDGNRNINAASSNQNGDASTAVPNAINVSTGTSVGSTAGRAGDAFAPRGGSNGGSRT